MEVANMTTSERATRLWEAAYRAAAELAKAKEPSAYVQAGVNLPAEVVTEVALLAGANLGIRVYEAGGLTASHQRKWIALYSFIADGPEGVRIWMQGDRPATEAEIALARSEQSAEAAHG